MALSPVRSSSPPPSRSPDQSHVNSGLRIGKYWLSKSFSEMFFHRIKVFSCIDEIVGNILTLVVETLEKTLVDKLWQNFEQNIFSNNGAGANYLRSRGTSWL